MKTFLVAEVGMMHDGSLGNARKFIDVAAECGADAIKFQSHIAEAETLKDAPTPPYFKNEPRFDYFKRTEFAAQQWKALKSHAEKKNLVFMSSAFSIEAVDLLEGIGMQIYKIPSGEVTNIPYLRRVAKTRRPVFLSSGMSSWKELDEASQLFRRAGAPLTILQCTSLYPCPYESVGLNLISEMRARYKCPVGLSDHTITNYASYAAVVLGASVIEKHLTLSRNSYGSDAKHSLEPSEFSELATGLRAIERMLAHPVNKNDLSRVKHMKGIFEKSIVSVTDIPRGQLVKEAMLGFKKPGGGLAPKEVRRVVGRRAKRLIPADRRIRLSDLERFSHR